MEGSKPEIGNRLFTGKETNAAVVFDAISEGEIVGLVNATQYNNMKGIYLNKIKVNI